MLFKDKKNLILTAYSDAFISVIPYVLLMTISTMLSAAFDFFDLWNDIFSNNALQYSAKTLSEFFPFVLLITISFQLAKRNGLNHSIVMLTSLAIFISVEALVHSSSGLNTVLSTDSPILALIIPLLVVMFLPLISKGNQQYLSINGELNSIIQHSLSVVITFSLITFVIFVLETSLLRFFDYLDIDLAVPDNLLLLIRTISNHLLWFFGLHGSNFFDSMLGTEYLNHPFSNSLSYKQLYDLFVIYGGSGAGLSLLLAIFLVGKDVQSKRVAKLALPFVIFNINEILIFGIPIIFNKKLFVPFISVPVINYIIAYTALALHPIEFINADAIPWTTPALINVIIASDGSFFALGLQITLISLGVVIYAPYIKKYTESQSYSFQQESLTNKLNIKTHLVSKQDLEAYKAKNAIIESNKEVEKFICLLNNAELLVYYQPKVNIVTRSCNKFEALLRIKINGSVKGPYFLSHLEEAGLATIIDLWVCYQVDEHLKLWRQLGFNPQISINIHPDTLSNKSAILEIVEIFSENNVDFEIIERGLLASKSSIENIYLLKNSGFTISIDDFGTGFSNFEILCSLPVDSLKIDKSLIDLVLTPKGRIACNNIARLSQDMGFTCVAEGVESLEQHDVVSTLNISYIQGYCYSPALPFKKVPEYSPHKVITG